MQIYRSADANRDAVDAGNERLLQIGQRQQEVPDFGAALAASRNSEEIGQIVPG